MRQSVSIDAGTLYLNENQSFYVIHIIVQMIIMIFIDYSSNIIPYY